MAISRFAASRLTQGLPKYQTAWDQDNVEQGAIVPIATFTATGSGTGISFSSIPQIYKDLVIVQNLRSDRSATYELFWQRFNGDTASNYSYTYINGNGTSSSSSRTFNQTVTNRFNIPAASASAGIFGSSIVHIMDYANTVAFKTILCRSSVDTSSGGDVNFSVGTWRSTAAITFVTVATENGSNLIAGSTITLYGIKAGI